MAPPMPTSASGRGTAVEPLQVGADRREGVGQHLLGDGAVEAEPLGEACCADVDAEALVDAIAVAEGELRAAAARVEHHERGVREPEGALHRDVGEPAFLLAGDDLDADPGALLDRVQEGCAVGGDAEPGCSDGGDRDRPAPARLVDHRGDRVRRPLHRLCLQAAGPIEALSESRDQIDLSVFSSWVDALGHDEPGLAAFYARRFRPEFRPAVDAWRATKPFTNPNAPLSPFRMPQYELAAREQANRLEAEADVLAAQGRANVQRSTNYVLCVVLFASALFLAGISTKLQGRGVRRALLAFGVAVFVATIMWIATFPISFAV